MVDRASEIPALEATVRFKALHQMLRVMQRKLTGPERLVGRGRHFYVILIVLAVHSVGIKSYEGEGAMLADLPDEMLSQSNLARIAERIGSVAQLDNLAYAQHVRSIAKLLCVGGNRFGFRHADRVPAIVGHANADEPPTGIRPAQQGPTKKQGRVIGVGHNDQDRSAIAALDFRNSRHAILR